MEAVVTPKNVRVRIAPSPTGFLHVGTARTALFNYLFAKRYGGAFILRIEDTDGERSEERFTDDIIASLKWLGLMWDEGPEAAGAYGPYRQRERTATYAEHLERLLAGGKAYYCFCTKDELAAQREYMMTQGMAPKYSGKCAALPREEAERKKKSGMPCIIRFRAPVRRLSFSDMVKGKIEFDTELAGDFAIAKSITEPLYNFAAAVDDALMEITHVIRGEDHISNTPKQILIVEALGLKTPHFGHLPLLLGPDRSKLSKRHGAEPISEYKAQGYLAEALVNFIALLGWNPGNDRELFSLAELEREFDVKKVGTANAVFNIQKLDWFNGQYIRRKPFGELAALCAPYVTGADAARLEKAVLLERDRMKRLSDIAALADFIFAMPEYPAEMLVWKKSTKENAAENLTRIGEALEQLSETGFTAAAVKEVLAPLAAERGNGEVYWPMRVALSGHEASPGPAEIAEALGKSETLARIRTAIATLSA